MTFFSDPRSHYSHRVRIVLAEKGVSVDILNADPENVPEDVISINPYATLPTLVDRELVLYEPNVMMEYLDERFPHPPLLPVYPVARAQCRLWIYRIQRDWCSLADIITSPHANMEQVTHAQQTLKDSVVAVAPIFEEKPYFMSEEFSLVDCCIAPIFWRLPSMGIKLPRTKTVKPLLGYCERLFERDTFQVSLSDIERELQFG